ncbi:MAG: zinc-dependent metalloprotease [Ferruginibacter sp.]
MRLISTFLICFAFLIFPQTNHAQIKCGSDELRAQLIAQDPTYKVRLDEMDRAIRNYINANPPSVTSFTAGTLVTLYYIPVVVHVIYDGNATVPSTYNPAASQITGAINYMNQIFDGTWIDPSQGATTGAGDLQIKFVLATKDPSNAATSGIIRVDGAGLTDYSAFGIRRNGASGPTDATVKNLSRWDPEKYYNIWLVSKIDGCSGIFCGCSCDAGFVAGYATFPPSVTTSASSRDSDGTVMLTSQMLSGNKVLPHELGHALNLYHPFQGNGEPATNNCPANATPATQGDLCTDTEPITNPGSLPNAPLFACRTGLNSCAGTNYTDNTEKNFMNYTNCYKLFTNDQKARMQASLATTRRISLATSWANNQGTYPAPFVAPPASLVTPSSANPANANFAGILIVTLNGKTVYSLYASQESMYLNNSGKWYDAFELLPSTAYAMNFTVLNSGNRFQLGVWIDYDNNGIFNTTNEQEFLNTDLPSGGTTTAYTANFTTPATWAGGSNFVRMRLMQDLSIIYAVPAISPASAVFLYGQAEDYPVFLTGGVVPVSLISFTGKQASDAITLRWNTSQEINTTSFEVERSVRSGAYRNIGTVTALGASGGAEYTFRDADIGEASDYLYRLKIKDTDGTFRFSNILKFLVEKPKQLIVTGNPFKDQIHLVLPYQHGNAMFRVTDAAGRIVYSKSIALSGTATETLYLSNAMSKGMYILEALINGERFTQKLIKE